MLNLSEIIPDRLWVGGYVREDEVPRLRLIGITTVLSLQVDEDMQRFGISPIGLAQAYQEAGIEFRRVPIPDFNREGLERSLPAAVAQVSDVLATPHTRLYLHCTEGISRAPTTAAGYLIRSHGVPACEAYGQLTSRRDCSPALDILERYDASLRGETH
jgi:protein tyrosine phosphatase (PTP) superfamily phosphohydrolase (DUF442 family)